ncbi:MAG: Uma2 family endonuclease [Pyrinomonadaceae bacterium]|nr:Uma2 family endonuclease [Pyrinomonadaceae bacterium]
MSEKGLNQTENKYSTEDYLMTQRRNSTKNEFNDGQVMGKATSNRWHNLISTNAAIAIGGRLHGHKCDIYVNAMCVRIKTNRFCYPDVIIVNGEPTFADTHQDILLNPTIIAEIFSGKTNTTDKNEKLESYLAMDSIRECLLIKEDEMRVEHYAKQNPKQWIYRIYNERDDVISLEAVNCKVSLQEIYAQLKFKNAEVSSKAAT